MSEACDPILQMFKIDKKGRPDSREWWSMAHNANFQNTALSCLTFAQHPFQVGFIFGVRAYTLAGGGNFWIEICIPKMFGQWAYY